MTHRNDTDYLSYIAALQALARAALPAYGLDETLSIALLSHSENTVFRLDDHKTGWRAAMRVHRPQYQTFHAIQSELDWMASLNQAGIRTPQALRALDGSFLHELEVAPAGRRMVAIFEWVDGDFPDERNLTPSLEQLGALSARMHQHSRQWQRPAYFERPAWDMEDTVGETGRWGRWRDAPWLSAAQLEVLTHARALMGQRLAAFGRAPDKFGLIHADLRMANLLVQGEATTIIDFDDCGLGWFLHDMASALSFIEHRPDRHALMMSWAQGYARHGALDEQDLAEFPTFLLQRRMQLLAWMGSHSETDLARSLGPGWVAASVQLAADYLRTMH